MRLHDPISQHIYEGIRQLEERIDTLTEQLNHESDRAELESDRAEQEKARAEKYRERYLAVDAERRDLEHREQHWIANDHRQQEDIRRLRAAQGHLEAKVARNEQTAAADHCLITDLIGLIQTAIDGLDAGRYDGLADHLRSLTSRPG